MKLPSSNSKILLYLAWITVFLLTAPLAIGLASVLIPNDFDVYLEAARAITHSSSPYLRPIKITVSESQTAECYYLYPPLLASVFRIFLFLDGDLARTIWNIINLSALMITGVAGSYAGLWSKNTAPLAAFTLFVLPFSLDAFSTGQVDCIVLACYALLLAAIANGNAALAGGALALAIHLKASPVLLLIPLLYTQNKRPLYYTLLFTVGMFLIITAMHGTEIWEAFLHSSRLVGAGERSWNTPSNRSSAKLLLALLPTGYSTLFANSAILLLSVAALTFLSRKCPNDIGNSSIKILGIGITIATVTSPIVWYHHLMWLTLPFCIAWLYNKSLSSRGILLGCALSLALSLILDTTVVNRSSHSMDLNADWSGITVIVSVLLCWLLSRRGRYRNC